MPLTVTAALAALKDLGTPAQMRALADRPVPGRHPNVPAANAHVHLPPNFSAFSSVRQAVERAADEGLAALGVSNYYDYDVYGDFVQLARARGIFPLFGLEIIALVDSLRSQGVKINDPGNPGKLYICGKGITRFARRGQSGGLQRARANDQNSDHSPSAMTAPARELLDLIRRNDSARMRQMVAKIEAVCAARGLATGLDEARVIDMVVRRNGCDRACVCLQERHVAQAFQEAIFASAPANPPGQLAAKLEALFGKPVANPAPVSVQNDLRSALMKAGKAGYVEETFVSYEQARKLILELGGIPCYPVLADGAAPVSAFEGPVEKLIANLKAMDLWAVEFIPPRNSPMVLAEYVTKMRQAGLVVSAGTEHNTLDLIPMTPHCAQGAPLPNAVRPIFWEGACVIVAHQFLSLHGEVGLVDANGQLNPAYKDANERIVALAKLGAAVIAQYQKVSRT